MHSAVGFSGRSAAVAPSAERRFTSARAVKTRASAAAAEYAVIDVNGRKHWVYEGSSFAICKRALEEVSLGGTVRFQRVLALKQQAGELLKGRPYVEGAVVEGRLEDEFKAPTAWSSTWSMATQGTVDSEDEEGTQPERTLRRILITRIQG